ncbi:helix-turn-helix transcriptional regulator [Micromonospora echinofusca]|uniref:DNA-binding response regulator n=1 Tax=Micromonospora echinofusca TaxID=47858 RepID=A0ABS3VNI2_MICEH|nr:response regulator transcription factor [Micromonospora echinofusca]MBO4206109.1 DNA-binding response regulator [Micromonospora echinofusca]
MTRQAGTNRYSIVEPTFGAIRPGLDDFGWSIGVAHRDELIRTGLESLASGLGQVRKLESHADWPGLAERLCPESRPDVLIVEHGMVRGDESRMAAVKKVKSRIILLLETAENMELAAAAPLAPDGFLVERGLTSSILASAVRQTMSGLVPMAPQVASGMLAELKNPNRISVLGLNQLTPREQETLGLLVAGCSNKQIASRLGISINGAKRHVANVLAKLNCPNRTVAAAEAVRLGVI